MRCRNCGHDIPLFCGGQGQSDAPGRYFRIGLAGIALPVLFLAVGWNHFGYGSLALPVGMLGYAWVAAREVRDFEKFYGPL